MDGVLIKYFAAQYIASNFFSIIFKSELQARLFLLLTINTQIFIYNGIIAKYGSANYSIMSVIYHIFKLDYYVAPRIRIFQFQNNLIEAQFYIGLGLMLIITLLSDLKLIHK